MIIVYHISLWPGCRMLRVINVHHAMPQWTTFAKFALHDCRYAIAAIRKHINVCIYICVYIRIHMYICMCIHYQYYNIYIYIISITIQLYMEGIWQISPVSEPENDRDSLGKLVKCSERSYVSTSTLSICSAFHQVISDTISNFHLLWVISKDLLTWNQSCWTTLK